MRLFVVLSFDIGAADQLSFQCGESVSTLLYPNTTDTGQLGKRNGGEMVDMVLHTACMHNSRTMDRSYNVFSLCNHEQ